MLGEHLCIRLGFEVLRFVYYCFLYLAVPRRYHRFIDTRAGLVFSNQCIRK